MGEIATITTVLNGFSDAPWQIAIVAKRKAANIKDLFEIRRLLMSPIEI
jgi:hypothetical protein